MTGQKQRDAAASGNLPGSRSAPRRLTIPELPADVVARPALWDRLEDATRSGKVILLAAGAGYGKSVTLSSWVRQRPGAHAWVTLDVLDDDPHQLAGDLLRTLQDALTGSPASEALEQLRPPPGFLDPQRFAESLLDALGRSATDQGNLLLVLDDAQRMSASEEATALLEYLLRWSPSNLRFALAARSDPPVLSRLLLEDRLEVIRQRDLAFSTTETGHLLSGAEVRLSSDLVQAVHEAVGGWPAGVRMAALSLKDSDDVAAAVAAFASRDQALSDYLVGEVLDHLPDRLRRFVLRATVDDEVCAALVDRVTGDTDADALLAACARQNLFLSVSRDDGEGRWYAWHQVFANHMRRRLAYEDSGLARHDRLAAAEWWAPLDPLRAGRHLIAGGDPAAAGDLLSRTWLGLALRGLLAPALTLAKELPADSPYAAEAELARAMAWVQASRATLARVSLERAESAASRLPDERRIPFEAKAGILRLLLVNEHGDLTDAVESARSAAHAFDEQVEGTDAATAAFVAFGLGLGNARLQTELSSSIVLLQRARDLSVQADLPVIDILARAELCVPLITTGRLGEIAAHAEATLADAVSRGWEALPIGVARGYLGWYAYWQDRLGDARRLLSEALGETLGTDWANRWLIVFFHGLACLADGDVETAREDVTAAEQMLRIGSLPPYAESMLVTLSAELLVSEGSLDAAVAATEQHHGRPVYRLATCTAADRLRRVGRTQDCLDLLESVEPADLYPQIRATIEVTRALALASRDDADGAWAALEAALAAASPDALLRPFMARREELVGLLVEQQRAGTARPELVALLLDRMNSDSTSTARGKALLTPRELSILAYLPSPMSIAEIADSRVVSVNTIKSHLGSIYRKLGVTSRREAVRRADELGLLGGPRP